MICKMCNNSKIKSKVNYTHGKKSRAICTKICKKCGSTSVQVEDTFRNRRR